MRRQQSGFVWCFVVLLAVSALTFIPAETVKESSEQSRPGSWAQPIELAGVPNLYRVDKGLYRSAQPTARGMRQLKKMGIRTIVNLRFLHSDRDEIGYTGLAYEHIPMLAWHPRKEDVVRFLQIATDPQRAPVLVHCQHGADRTGLLCAVYRIAVDGWSKGEAIREMTGGGFGFHGVWQNLISYIDNLDVEGIKKKAGLH
jgi:protein tyrosine/serine phosphatase